MKYILNYMRDGQVKSHEFEGTVMQLEKEILRVESAAEENGEPIPMVFKIEAEDGRVFHKVVFS